MDILTRLIELFPASVGFATLAVALIGLGKTIGFIKDGQAQRYSTLFSLIVAVVFAVFQKNPETLMRLDFLSAQAAVVLLAACAFIVQFGLSKYIYEWILRGTDWIGKSFSIDIGRANDYFDSYWDDEDEDSGASGQTEDPKPTNTA